MPPLLDCVREARKYGVGAAVSKTIATIPAKVTGPSGRSVWRKG